VNDAISYFGDSCTPRVDTQIYQLGS